MTKEKFSHTYSIPNFALALPYLDLNKPADQVMTQLRGVASYGVFTREREALKQRLKNMDVAGQLKRGRG